MLCCVTSLDHLGEEVEANQISVDFNQYLKDNEWVNGNDISRKSNETFMLLFFYMTFLKERNCKSTLFLENKPTENLHKLSLTLKTKWRKKAVRFVWLPQ